MVALKEYIVNKPKTVSSSTTDFINNEYKVHFMIRLLLPLDILIVTSMYVFDRAVKMLTAKKIPVKGSVVMVIINDLFDAFLNYLYHHLKSDEINSYYTITV